MKPTIRDIAAKLGIGKSTVQRVISGDPRCSEKTRRAVIEEARKSGYQPDPLFSILGSQGRRSRTRCLQIAFVAHGGADLPGNWSEYFESACRRAGQLGYELTHIDPHEFGGGDNFMSILYHRGFAGVLVATVRAPDHHLLLANEHLPVVCCGRIDLLPLHTVQPDVIQPVRLGWQKLLDHGYRRIGPAICAHRQPVEDDNERLGAVLALQRNTLSPTDHLPPLLAPVSDEEAFLKWFRRYKPDSVLAFRGANYWKLRDAGIPMEKIGFVSMHAAPAGSDPVVAGIVECLDTVASESVNFLDQLIRHRKVGVPELPIRIQISGVWRDGESLREKNRGSSNKNRAASRAG